MTTEPDNDLENPNGDPSDSDELGGDLESPAQNSPETPPEAPNPFDGADAVDDGKDDDEDWGQPNDVVDPAPPVAPTHVATAAPDQSKFTECLVRIRRPKIGKKVKSTKRYATSYGGKTYRFRVDFGWYQVPIALGMKLREARVHHGDDDSPRVFEVSNLKHADKIEEKELLATESAKGKSSENPATDPRTATK